MLKGLLKTQLLVRSYSEGALQKREKEREKEGRLGDIYINLWLLTSEGRRLSLTQVTSPLTAMPIWYPSHCRSNLGVQS